MIVLLYWHNIIVPGVVQNLKCAGSSSETELSLSWEPPTMTSNDVVSYLVEMNRLEHRSGIRKVTQSNVHKLIEENQTIINQGLGIEYAYELM